MWYELFTGNEVEVRDHVNGAAFLRPLSTEGVAVGGLTVVFSDPFVVVTFSGSAGDVLSPGQIFAELLTSVPGLQGAMRIAERIPNSRYMRMLISLWHADGFTISEGTALTLLGITAPITSAGPLAVAGISQARDGNGYAALCIRS